jgi:hypothetical protein
MLDRDLADLYQVPTFRLNEAVYSIVKKVMDEPAKPQNEEKGAHVGEFITRRAGSKYGLDNSLR